MMKDLSMQIKIILAIQDKISTLMTSDDLKASYEVVQ